MNFQVGQTLELDVVKRDINYSGLQYLIVTDGEHEFRVSNLLKCQLVGELPQKLYVVVKSIDAFGKVKLIQDIKQVLNEHYEKDKMYSFDITRIQKDANEKKYYVIEDDFAEQNFYINGEQKHEIGDHVVLICKGTNKSGWLNYEEYTSQPISSNSTEPQPITQIVATNSFNAYGPESIHVEYKTSIVFSSKTSEPDLESQLKLIISELAALMNTDGGHLIIGVKDETKGYEITGIEQDFPYLNDDPNDDFQYSQNTDGYRLKILHQINYLCKDLAGTLVHFNFKNKNNHQYCVIDVKKSDRLPIWVKGEKDLFIRQDGRTKRLSGDALSEYIFKMMLHSVKLAAGSIDIANLDNDKLTAIVRTVINAQKPTIELPPAPQREIDYWVIWDDKGNWHRQRTKEDSYYIQLPVYKNMSKPLLVICYKESKKVVVMDWATTRKKTNLNQVQTSLWNPLEKPSDMYIAEPNDLLLIESVDHNGQEFVKLHAFTDFSIVKTKGTAGAPILPQENSIELQRFGLIESYHHSNVKDLIVPKAKRSVEKGTPKNTNASNLAQEIAYINTLNS